MRRYKLFLLLLTIFAAGVITCVVVFNIFFINRTVSGDVFVKDYNMDKDEFKITDAVSTITKNIICSGCVRNEVDAVEIAKVILKSVYGEDYDNGLPMLSRFDATKQEWLISNQLPDGAQGGQLYIIIKKSNAEVVAIWGTK